MIDIICHFNRKLSFVTLKLRFIWNFWFWLVEISSEKEEYFKSDGEESSDGSIDLLFFLFFVCVFLCSISEHALINIFLAVTDMLAVIITIDSTINIYDWLKMYYLESRRFSLSLSDMIQETFLVNLFNALMHNVPKLSDTL